jgi:RNA polymerase sigma-70 factor (ECF subfamily)
MIDGEDESVGARSTAGQLDARIDLEAALARLPAGARVVFVLHDIEGYSHDEIARMTGIAAGTARAQLWRARRALMTLLDA